MYDSSTGIVVIRDGTNTTTIQGLLDLSDLSALPMTKVRDSDDFELFNGSTAWTVGFWSADLDSITEDEFIALTHSIDPVGTWWYIDDADNFESIIITSGGTTNGSDGTIDFNEIEDGAQGEIGTIFYTLYTDSTYGGDVVGIQENDGGAYGEYIKFFESVDKVALEAAFPDITWTDGAAAVKNAGISVVDSFESWSDAGEHATVSYTTFEALLDGMIYGNSSTDDDGFITGNGQDALVFATGTANTATSGDIVVASSGEAAGTFEIKDVDGVSTLVVYIIHQDFIEDDDHVAFQYTDEGDGAAMYRGDINDRWSDLLLNTIAKDDVMSYLAP